MVDIKMSVTEPYRVVPMTKLRKGKEMEKKILFCILLWIMLRLNLSCLSLLGEKKKYYDTFLYNPGIDFRL